MKKVVLIAVVALGVSFGGDFEDCVNECKARKGADILADIQCESKECKHLAPKENISGGSSEDTMLITHPAFTPEK